MKKVVFVNIGMMMFRGGGENFDINMSKAWSRNILFKALI